jgi:hypothetical protein
MRHHTARAILLAVVAGVLGGCASRTLDYLPSALVGLQDPSVHILTARWKTAPVTGSFGWGYCLFRVSPDPSIQLSAVGERLHRAMAASLTAKGLTFADSDPDLLVSYALASEAAVDEKELNNAYGDLIKAPVQAAETALNYKRGTLVIDVVERVSGHLLWRGAIMAEADLSWPEERRQERCDAVVGELLRHYPRP